MWAGKNVGGLGDGDGGVVIVKDAERLRAVERSRNLGRDRDDEVSAYWLGKLGAFVATEQQRLEREQRAGTVSAEMDCANTARLLAGMVERTISLHCAATGPEADPPMAKALARSIWLTVYG